MYPADGRKFFDVYAWPYSLRTEVKADLGEFPFPGFWGPVAGRSSPQGTPDCATRWIANAAKWVEQHHQPSLSLVYLPHLDYNLQRFGTLSPATPTAGTAPVIDPRIHQDLREIDAIVGDLLQCFQERGVQPVIVSEYGITNVQTPVHLNRIFRERGWLVVKEELGLELLDAGASRVFAVADHQIAHIYVNDRSLLQAVGETLAAIPGVASVLGTEEKREAGLDHPRAGDWIAVARENAWFTYYYWLDNDRAPDFARCVDIHRKPGYDPVELFLDPALKFPKLRIAQRLLQKKLGFRMLMDVIPLDASLVKGSHGCRPRSKKDWPVLIASPDLVPADLESTDVYHVIRRAVLK